MGRDVAFHVDVSGRSNHSVIEFAPNRRGRRVTPTRRASILHLWRTGVECREYRIGEREFELAERFGRAEHANGSVSIRRRGPTPSRFVCCVKALLVRFIVRFEHTAASRTDFQRVVVRWQCRAEEYN